MTPGVRILLAALTFLSYLGVLHVLAYIWLRTRRPLTDRTGARERQTVLRGSRSPEPPRLTSLPPDTPEGAGGATRSAGGIKSTESTTYLRLVK